MEDRRCSVCGRILTRTVDTIGPVCAAKLMPWKKKRVSGAILSKYIAEHDIFREEDNESGKDASSGSNTSQ